MYWTTLSAFAVSFADSQREGYKLHSLLGSVGELSGDKGRYIPEILGGVANGTDIFRNFNPKFWVYLARLA